MSGLKIRVGVLEAEVAYLRELIEDLKRIPSPMTLEERVLKASQGMDLAESRVEQFCRAVAKLERAQLYDTTETNRRRWEARKALYSLVAKIVGAGEEEHIAHAVERFFR